MSRQLSSIESQTIPSQAHRRVRLRQARYLHHWSQQELADLLGTTALSISRWERGLTTPHPYFRYKLCNLFGQNEIELGLSSDSALRCEANHMPQSNGLGAPRLFIDPALPLPATLPLLGRAALIAKCTSQLSCTRSLALHGQSGVGKTALALELAYNPEVRACYPDGLLWASLGPQPQLLTMLSRWGQLLGIHENEAARLETTQDWIHTLRATIGERRLVIILDDAWDLDIALACQVGGPRCAYILTTRLPYLAQGVALYENYPVNSLEEQVGLDLIRYLAPWAVEQAPETIRALVQEATGLPSTLILLGYTLRQQTHNRQPRRLFTALENLQKGVSRLQAGQSW